MRAKLILFLVLVGVLAIALVGCGPTVVPPTEPPVVPQLCSLRVISSSPDCWGYVYVNGMNTGQYLYSGGVVIISNISNVSCGQTVAVQLVDEYGESSHTEYVFLQGGETVVNFSYWW